MLPGAPDLQKPSPDDAAAPWQAVRGVARAAGDLITAWQRAEEASALSGANARAAQGLASLQTEMMRAPEAGTLDGARTLWTARTGELRASIAEGLPARVRGAFANSFTEMEANRRFNVEREAFQRQAQAAVGEVQTNLATFADGAAASNNPAEREGLIGQGLAAIQRAVESGLMNPERAGDIARRFQQQIAVGTARRLIVENPGAAVNLLRDPNQLRGLTPARRYQMLDQAIRAQRRGGGGLGMGEGPGAEEVPELPAGERLSLSRQGEALAMAEDAAAVREAEATERAGLAQAASVGREATDRWFAAAVETGGAFVTPPAQADLMPAVVAMAAETVMETGGAGRDDPDVLDRLLTGAGEADPGAYEADAALAVAEGRLTPAGFLSLTSANRTAMADTPDGRAWRAARGEAADMLAPPDPGDLAPGLPDLGGGRRAALAEMDAWRAANPAAPASAAREEARGIMLRHRERMVAGLVGALPAPEGLAGLRGPFVPEALDGAEDAVLSLLDAGAIGEADAARRLRVIDLWRWAGEDVAE